MSRPLFARVTITTLYFAAVASFTPSRAPGQLLETNAAGTTVGEYTTTGAAINANFITGLNNPIGIATSNGKVYVYNGTFNGGPGAGAVGVYDAATGSAINRSLIQGLPGGYLAVSGNEIFVDVTGGIAAYSTAGSLLNSSLVSGLTESRGMAVYGDRLYVVDRGAGRIGEYTLSGTVVNAALISGLSLPDDIAISDGQLFVTAKTLTGTPPAMGWIGQYDATTGAVVNPKLIDGLTNPDGIAVSDANIFVATSVFPTSWIGEYTTSGQTVNANLISGLAEPVGLAVVPEPSALALLATGVLGLLGNRCFKIAGASSARALVELSRLP